jgi:CDP-6-deoxy-D-xylo-4-hexulose-3-dehydrase
MESKENIRKKIHHLVKEYYSSVHLSVKSDKINYAGRIFDENEIINLVDSALDFWLTHGKYSQKFEEKLGEFLNVKYVLMVNSGSSANLLAFMALTSPLLGKRQIKRGDEIITVAAGFPTTVAPILQYGAVPVFVDIDIETVNIDVTKIENAITDKTKAIIIAHTLGNPFDIDKVKQFCEKYNLWLIEDNCDALGSKYNGKYTGTFGDIGTSSFYPAHHITTGEGGAVWTNNPFLKKILLSMRDWGRDCWCESGRDNTCGKRFSGQHGKLPFGYDHKYVYSHFGFNMKATEMQAAIGIAQLDKLSDFIKIRQNNFNYLLNSLKKFEKYFIFQKPLENTEPSWFGFLITIRDHCPFSRNEIVKFLESRGIQTRNLFAGNLLKQPCFESLKRDKDYKVTGELSNTDKIMNDSFWIGVYPGLSTDNLNFICDIISVFLSKY